MGTEVLQLMWEEQGGQGMDRGVNSGEIESEMIVEGGWLSVLGCVMIGGGSGGVWSVQRMMLV